MYEAVSSILLSKTIKLTCMKWKCKVHPLSKCIVAFHHCCMHITVCQAVDVCENSF